MPQPDRSSGIRATSPTPAPCADSCPLAAPTLDRRAFLANAGLTAAYAAAAAALAACASGGDDPTSPSSIPTTTLNVASYSALAATGGVITTTIGNVPIAIVRTGTSSFLALSRICPHQGYTVNVQSSGFYCPKHGATFNSTGTWIGGERTNSMTAYPTSYDASTGTLTIG